MTEREKRTEELPILGVRFSSFSMLLCGEDSLICCDGRRKEGGQTAPIILLDVKIANQKVFLKQQIPDGVILKELMVLFLKNNIFSWEINELMVLFLKNNIFLGK